MDQGTSDIIIKLLGIAYMVFEMWLGRTHKVKANSSLELIADAGLAVIKKIPVRLSDIQELSAHGGFMQLKELKELITLLTSAIQLGIKIVDDGKVSITDIPYVFDFVSKLAPGIQGIELIPSELSQMTDEDSQNLISFVMTELKLPEGKAKEIVQMSLQILSQIYSLVKVVKK